MTFNSGNGERGSEMPTPLQFFIRHHPNFLRDKFILVFKSNEARDYFEQALKGSHFEPVSSKEAENAARIGINGKVISYGYTTLLTDEEMNELSTMDWDATAALLAEGNERLYEQAVKEKEGNEQV